MPINLNKLKGHIALGLSIRPSVRLSFHQLQIEDRVLKFHRWIPHQKVTDPNFFFLNLDYLSLWSYAPFFRVMMKILYSGYLKNYNSYELHTCSGYSG